MSKIKAGTTSGTALVTEGDTTGQLVFQTNGTTTALTLGTDQSATFAGNVVINGSVSAPSPFTVAGNSTAGAEIRLPEDTDNGSNYVALKAPNTLASNLTLTLPTADGTNGQVLQTNGSGQLAFATVDALPSQTGNSGKYLTTNGTTASWGSLSLPGANGRWSFVDNSKWPVSGTASGIDSGEFFVSSSINNYQGDQFSCAPVWSAYYNLWFNLASDSAGTGAVVYVSKNGINWTPYLSSLRPKIGSPGSYNYINTAGFCNLTVDDSNGRLWTFWATGSTINGYYKDASTARTSNWTQVTVASTGSTATYNAARYIATASSSEIAVVGFDGTGGRIYTCPAGSTSFALAGTSSFAATSQASNLVYDYDTGKVLVTFADRPNIMFRNGTGVGYDSTSAFLAGSLVGGGAGVGGGYFVTTVGNNNNSNLYYSSNGSSWTLISSPCGGNIITTVYYLNGAWYAGTQNGIYKTTQNPPTSGWTNLEPTSFIGKPSIRTQP